MTDKTLFDEMKVVTFGHTVKDVAHLSVTMMIQCLVQMSDNKQQALRALDVFSREMAKEIDQNYNDMRADTERVMS